MNPDEAAIRERDAAWLAILAENPHHAAAMSCRVVCEDRAWALAEINRLTDYIDHEPSALTIRLAERARIREAVEADLQVSLRRYEEARSARQWTRADRSSGAIRALEDVLAAIEGEK